MILIGGLPYDVHIISQYGRHKYTGEKYHPGNAHKYITVRMRYCGGSCVDDYGHHVAGGVWAKGEHPNVRYFRDLPVANISECEGVDYSWAHMQVASGRKISE